MLNAMLAYMLSCVRQEARLALDQRILCSDCCKKMNYGSGRHSFRIMYCIEARYLWGLRSKLHMCAACCSTANCR